MSVSPTKLFHDSVPNPEATIYTAPADVIVVLRRLSFANTTAGAVAASLSINGKRVVPAESVPANRRLEIELAVPLAPGDTISALTAVAGALTLLATGFTIS